MAKALKPLQDKDAKQVPQVQAVSSGIKATIQGQRPLGCCLFQLIVCYILQAALQSTVVQYEGH